MKKQTAPQTTQPKLFSLRDVAVYSAVLAVVVLLFIFLVLSPSSASAQGFKIVLDGVEIARYDYTNTTLTVTDGYQDYVTVDQNAVITVYSNQSKSHYNLLKVDSNAKSVKVIDANCSTSKECVYTPAVKGDNGAIVCAPHKLKIVPLSQSGMIPPQTGGA